MAPNTNTGIQNKRRNGSVDETVKRLERTLQAKGVTVFAIIDHSGEAEKVRLKMRPTKLVIFGSPKAGTPLMLAGVNRGSSELGLYRLPGHRSAPTHAR